MSMVEVDPKLFVTCRLCLEDSGTYQIVPSIQEQINYCFGIQVEPFDGFPQLLCKKCQSNLVVYANVKKHFVTKQEELKKIVHKNNLQQKDAKNTSPAIDLKDQKIALLSNGSEHSRKSCNESVVSSRNQSKNSVKKDWELEYRKTFACRICDSHWLTWGSVMAHQTKHNALKLKHAKIFKRHCLVSLPKIDRNLNLTGSLDKVVYNKGIIIAKGTQDYYISYKYTEKTSNSNSDDEDHVDKSHKRSKFDESSDSSSHNISMRPKRRRRICSSTSNETVVLENKSNASDHEIDDDKKLKKENDCISIDDTDSETENNKSKKGININTKENAKEIAVSKLIASTLTKFNKKYENSTKQPQPSIVLQRRKILSVGRKIINKRGFNSHRVLKYLEQANLNMIWLSRSPHNITASSNYLKITTRVRSSSENNINDFEGYIKKYEKSENEQYTQNALIHTPNHTTTEKNATDAYTLERVSQESDALRSLVVQETSALQSILKGVSATATKAVPQQTLLQSLLGHESDVSKGSATVDGSLNKEQSHPAVQTVSNGIPHKSSFALSVTAESDAAMLYSTTANDTKKLLNANPVANPKQLPKKFNSDTKLSMKGKSASNMPSLELNANDVSPATTISGYENDMPMPVITFTTSLAVPQAEVSANNNEPSNTNTTHNSVNNTTSVNQNPTQTPRIKVKSVTELMSEETLSRMSQPTTTAMAIANQVPQITNNSTIEVYGSSQITNTTPVITNVRSISSSELVEDYVILDTVELPNTKTASPFKYFKMLLQMHSIILLDTDVNLGGDFHMLIRFKVLYKQETKDQPVILCLSLFCSKNVFCLRIKDRNEDTINMRKISANWQWEILKIYRGEVVTKLLSNAQKISQEVFDYTNRFLCLLKSINFVS